MKIEVRQVNGAVRLDLAGENAGEWQQLRIVVELLNGGPIDKEKGANGNPVFDAALRVESVGFNDAGDIESVAIEGSQ